MDRKEWKGHSLQKDINTDTLHQKSVAEGNVRAYSYVKDIITQRFG